MATGPIARLTAALQLHTTAPIATPTPTTIASPWTEGQLGQLVWSDLLDGDVLPVTRAEAMTVPAVVKARHLLVTYLAGVPLVAMNRAGALPTSSQPAWLYRTNGAVSPWHRMAWTLDDLLFHGWSLWRVTRGTDGQVLDAWRVPPEWWQITPDATLLVNGAPVRPDEAVLIPGPAEGLLSYARRTIRAARNVEDSWAGRVRNPIPLVELHQVTDDELEDDEITELLDTYCTARMDANGAVVYTPQSIELRVHGQAEADMLIGARNAVRLDVANLTGLPAEALDGSLSTASLTYTTQEGTRTEVSDALRMWREPIEARLSQDDCVPRGQRVRFDTTDLNTPTPSGTGPAVED